VSGALDGLIVADFSRVLAGPYASMLLGDMGATVIKVERPGSGDDTRSWSPPTDDEGVATYFSAVNRNKHSIALDLDVPNDRTVAQRVAQRADILIENFPPGALTKRGLGFQDVSRTNPGIIYCSISGFGSASDLPGYDLLVQAVGGLMDITGDAHPTKVGVAIVDVVTGLHALSAILAALHHRDRTGEGQLLEVNLLSSLLSSLVNQSTAAVITGESPTRLGNAHPSIAPYEPFPTADRDLIIAVGNDDQFARMCDSLGAPDWAVDPRFATNNARVANAAALRALITQRLSTDRADAWVAILRAARVPCGPINSIGQAIQLADDLGLEPVIDVEGSRQVAHPVRYSRTPSHYRLRPPSLDKDRDFVLDLLQRDSFAPVVEHGDSGQDSGQNEQTPP